MNEKQDRLRRLPGVDRLLNAPAMAALSSRCPHVLLAEAAQETVAELRRRILRGEEGIEISLEGVAQLSAELAERKTAPNFRRVINATGTLLHTNLGRAPLCDGALEAIDATARSYSNLEFDLESGKRGHRFSLVEGLLCRLTGAEAAAVVNNNAGAVLLALTALARGKEAVVSRGELVEIGGAFRVPDVMEAGGVILREVGTTNKTHLKDYRSAIGEETGLLLKIHTSNYRIVGFTAAVSAAEMVELGREKGVPVMEDLGSGMLFDLSPFGLPQEPTVRETVEAGVDLITFSGDKLLGGPQAGILVGRREEIDKVRSHPMARALRIDKLSLAALEATLRHYLDRSEALEKIPTLKMLALTPEEIGKSCRRLARKLRAAVGELAAVETVEESSQVGGGALPTTVLPGSALALTPKRISVDELAGRLRRLPTPVIGRLQEGRLLLNVRTLHPSEEKELVDALSKTLGAEGDSIA